MKRFTVLARVLAALLALAACAAVPRHDLAPDELAARLSSADAAVRSAAADEAALAGAPGARVAGDLLASADPGVAKAARRALFAIAHHSARPGAERERRAASAELAALCERSPSVEARRVALRALALVAHDARAVMTLAEALRDPGTFEAALFALECVPHPAAEDALIDALARGARATEESGGPDPVGAIARALGARGSVEAVPALVALAQGGGASAGAAREALARGADPRAEAPLRAALARGEPGALHDLLLFAERRVASGEGASVAAIHTELLASSEPQVRIAAARGLAGAGGPQALEALIAALDDEVPAVRAAAREGLVAIEARGAAVALKIELDRSHGVRRAELLRVVAARGELVPLERLAAALDDGDVEVRVAALELAGELAGPVFEQRLVQTAGSGSEAERAAAEGGLLRLARARQARGEDAAALGTYHALLENAHTPRVVTAALRRAAGMGSAATLARVEALAARPEYRDEADLARVAIAGALTAERRDEAVAVLDAVCDGGSSHSVRQAAARKLAALGVDTSRYAARRGFLVDWHLCGPFPFPPEGELAAHPFGTDGPVLPEPGLAPEELAALAPERRWLPCLTSDLDGLVDLRARLDPSDNVCAYAFATFDWPADAPADAAAVLKLGSDDGLVVWLDGERVHEHDVMRALGVDQDQVTIRPRAGRNALLLKITQGGGDWSFCARLCDADGTPLDLTAPVPR